MTKNEKQSSVNTKDKIRERYRGVDSSELTIIPAKPPKSASDGGKRRVAVYIRVSTDNDEQTSSFELQKNYYTDYVNAQPGWELVDIYADEGISGTKKDTRPALMQMLSDCEHGMIDYVVTKSISRLARNTTDCLEIVRKLLDLGIGLMSRFSTN